MAYSPLAMGRLTGKYSAANTPKASACVPVRAPAESACKSPKSAILLCGSRLLSFCMRFAQPACLCQLPLCEVGSGRRPALAAPLSGSHVAVPPPATQGARRFGNYSFDRIQPIVDRLEQLGQEHGGKTPAQVGRGGGATHAGACWCWTR